MNHEHAVWKSVSISCELYTITFKLFLQRINIEHQEIIKKMSEEHQNRNKTTPKHKKKKTREGRMTKSLSDNKRACLSDRAKQLTVPGKGLLDLSPDSEDLKKYFCHDHEEENRHQYLSLYLKPAKAFRFYVHGLLLSEEMLDFDKARRLMLSFKELGISLGVKLGSPASAVSGTMGECSSGGLDNLHDVCFKLTTVGAEFVMWAVEFQLTATEPTPMMLSNNCMYMARFAMTAQAAGLVPLLSVILMEDRELDMEMAQDKLKDILVALVKAMSDFHVYKEGVILAVQPLAARARPLKLLGSNGRNIPLGQSQAGRDVTVSMEHRRALATSLAVSRSVPASVGGIVVTNSSSSGTTKYNQILNDLNRCPTPNFPYHVGFCVQQATQDGFLYTWAGKDKNLYRAGDVLVKNMKECSDSTMGQLCSKQKSVFITNLTAF